MTYPRTIDQSDIEKNYRISYDAEGITIIYTSLAKEEYSASFRVMFDDANESFKPTRWNVEVIADNEAVFTKQFDIPEFSKNDPFPAAYQAAIRAIMRHHNDPLSQKRNAQSKINEAIGWLKTVVPNIEG